VSCRCTASNDGVDDASSASAELAVAAVAASAAAADSGNELALAVDADDEEEDDDDDDEGADAGLEGVSDAGRADAECDEEDDDDDDDEEEDDDDEARCRLMPSKNGCLSASAADMRRAGSKASRCRMRSTKHRSSGINCRS
jgi:hypothetical protein